MVVQGLRIPLATQQHGFSCVLGRRAVLQGSQAYGPQAPSPRVPEPELRSRRGGRNEKPSCCSEWAAAARCDRRKPVRSQK